MARPRTIRDEQILDAARALFLDKGYTASTAAIARAAGVSEGTVFKRFGTKERLFRAALGIPTLDLAGLLRERAGRDAPAETLLALAQELLAYFRALIPRVMMAWAHHSRGPLDVLRSRGTESPPAVHLRALAAYFDEEMRRGRLPPRNPEVLARLLVGALHNFVFFEVVGASGPDSIDERTFVREMLNVLLSRPSETPTREETAEVTCSSRD